MNKQSELPYWDSNLVDIMEKNNMGNFDVEEPSGFRKFWNWVKSWFTDMRKERIYNLSDLIVSMRIPAAKNRLGFSEI